MKRSGPSRAAVGYVERQRGSHVSLAKAGQPNTPSVPDHKELAPGTLRALIRDAGLTVDDFIRLLGRHQ